MRMTRQDLPKSTDSSTELVVELCNQARVDGGKDVATKLSGRLDRLATHAANSGLSAAEIVELIREEAVAIDGKGGAVWQ
ncbi:TPA: DUF2732 family protein [Klebsiella pneumoniae]|nr:DUF2732 family protein [Klebsiella pneumoniae]HBQ1007733.1 DUF2732 family protein [Klebsiella pneumoniae]HBQ1226914.1 DUF2732 family protein [Klebsiella pneumoniae]HBU6406160.1 DUF2732 family protein [Klebsiella pneumoniae]HBU6460618.1 DUF2732 family protein [Klebsiella pneumoniae]